MIKKLKAKVDQKYKSVKRCPSGCIKKKSKRKLARKSRKKSRKKLARKSRKKLARKSRKKLARKSRKKLARKSRKKLARKKSRKKLARKKSRKKSRKKKRKANRKKSRKKSRKFRFNKAYHETSKKMGKFLSREDILNLRNTSSNSRKFVSMDFLSFSGSNMDTNYVSSFQKMMAVIDKNKPTDTSGHIGNITKIKIYDMDLRDRTDPTEWISQLETESRIGKLVRVLGAFNIKYLEMKGCHITDITSLSALSKLETLNIERNKITDIGGLATLTKLKELDLQGNTITDIQVLSTLTQLKTLDLGYNRITDINGLATLTQLKTLNIRNNRITDIGGLATLTKLKELDFSLQNNEYSNNRLGGSREWMYKLNAKNDDNDDFFV